MRNAPLPATKPATITWLASFPKSGNTWLRILLQNYLHHRDEAADINMLSIGTAAAARDLFDEWVGVEAITLDRPIIDRLRSRVYRCLAEHSDSQLFLKVHDQWTRTDRGEAMFPTDVTRGVIYAIRNPLDLVASCAHHWGTSLDDAATTLCRESPTVPRSWGTEEQLPQRLGSWGTHVRSWVDDSGLPVLVVRYEDLWSDPHDTFARVVTFCGLPYDRDRVARSVEFSSFQRVQAQERSAGFRERSPAAPGGFFRNGRVGGWRTELAPHLIERISTAHGDLMTRFGYDS